jgi:Icc protein
MKLVHLSDLHLSSADTPLCGRRPIQHLHMCLDHVETDHGDADCMVISGDLVQHGEGKAYEILRERLADISMPVHLMVGNDDLRSEFRKNFPDHPIDGDGHIQSTADYGALRLIMLDTLDEGAHSGAFDKPRLKWFEAELQRAATDQRQVLLFLHHHPIKIGVFGIDNIRLRQADDLLDLISSNRNLIRHMAFGHCHMSMSGSVAGIPFSAPRSINHVCWPDLSGKDRMAFADLQPNYNVMLISPVNIVVHTIEYRIAPDLSNAEPPTDLSNV